MYGRAGQEVVLAADARTGKTLWEHATPVTFKSAAPERGNGPHATGLIVGDRLFTAGVTGRLQCLDKKTGKVLWTTHLWLDLKGTRLDYGYASSPFAFRDTLIVPVGGVDNAVAALKQSDGSPVWKKGTAGNAYSSPMPINVGGLEQTAVVMNGTVFAVNPHNGDLQWRWKHEADYGLNVSMPLWMPGNLMLVTSAYGAGTRVLHLKRDGLKTVPEQLWHANNLRIHHGNAQMIDGVLYFSNGDKGPAPMTAVQLKTGEILWQDRAFGKCTLLLADGKLIILDTDGDLALAKPNAKGLNVIARHSLLQSNAWTPPTLVGTKLYVRDRYSMMAVELGK
jgi:outer membrane protein assembly factor BamB